MIKIENIKNEKNFKDLNEKRNIFEENISSEQKYLVIDEQTSLQIQDKIPVEEEVYDLADLFKIFSDSTRIKILCILFESEMCVYDLSGILGMSQSAVSHQLRLLKQSKLVKHRREGKIIFYSLSDDHIRKIIDNGLEHIQE
ncbi:ArsR/SmtB family transcription factor [Peptoanaerobacter stomatis]|uniref:ArsR/SmtB family transcription factor n=1 Tax=Peptoanaerobacter stomatis TaxID=796937 RepID=UPI003FA054AB